MIPEVVFIAVKCLWPEVMLFFLFNILNLVLLFLLEI